MPIDDKVKAVLEYLASLEADARNDDNELLVRVRAEPAGRPEVFAELDVDTLRGATALAADALDQETSYSDAIAEEPEESRTRFQPSSWASGSGGAFGRLDNDATTYLDGLGQEMAQWLAEFVNPTAAAGENPDSLGDQQTANAGENGRRAGFILRRNNLFHGHLVIAEDMDDTYVVFHAAEYPKNLEEAKSTQAKQLEGAGAIEFTSADPGFIYRNVIWSLGHGKLWNPVYSAALMPGEHPAWALLKGAALDGGQDTNDVTAVTVAQDRMGTEVAGLNFFPNENIRSFWRFTPA